MIEIEGYDFAYGDAARDKDEMLALINLVQPHVPWSSEYFDWQYLALGIAPTVVWTMRQNGALICMVTAVAHRFRRADGVEQRSWVLQDLMTVPEHRGKGLAHALCKLPGEHFARNDDVAYLLTTRANSERVFRRLGYRVWGPQPWRRSKPRAAEPRGSIVEIERFDARAESIWLDAEVGGGVHRDAHYLNWRYGKLGQRYARFAIDGDAGFMVLKHYTEPGRNVVHLCDLVVRRGARDRLGAALDFAHAFARERNVTELTAWLPKDHPYVPAFDAAGLVLQEDTRWMMFGCGSATEAPLHLVQGDSDVF